MWLDPSTGKIFGQPGEFEEGLRQVDPLLRKAYLHPEQLTPQERREVELKLLSFVADYLPKSDIEDILREGEGQERKDSSDPVRDAASKQVLEGKLALREMGTLKQKHFERGLMNVQTGQIFTEADVAAARKKLRAKRGKTTKNKRKPKG